jgi:DNA-binding transcriptional LysR family regulator
MHNMDWDDLRFFLAVAEHRSLSAASRKLDVNHSTVFRRINRLEDAAGVRLFERLSDGYQLTQAGEDLMGHASRIRDEVDALTLQISGKDFQPVGVVRITAPGSITYHFLNHYLDSFTRLHPGINIEVNVSDEDLDLSRRETDIAIRATSNPPQYLIGKKVLSISWGFYAAEAYLRLKGTPASMAELIQHDLIGPEGRIVRLKAFQLLEKEFSPGYRLRGNNLSAIASFAVAGSGIALLPDDQIHTGLRRLFSMEPRITSDLWVLTHPELRANERIRLLMNFLVDRFRNDSSFKNYSIENE